MDTWNLVWIVVCSDTIIKFIIISLKSSVTLMPYSIIPLRKRVKKYIIHNNQYSIFLLNLNNIIQGNYYSVVETISLLYRSLIPIYPWVLFLMYTDLSSQSFELKNPIYLNKSDVLLTEKKTDTNVSTAFPIILCILYFMCKINQLYNRSIEVIQSIRDLINDLSYGVPVSLNDLEENICPICQDKLSSPVILKCKVRKLK